MKAEFQSLQPRRHSAFGFWLALIGLLVMAAGCTAPRDPSNRPAGPFRFESDTVGFTNETRWLYTFDAEGRMTHTRRDPPPTYGLRCFVVCRLNRQFYDHATFSPQLPRPDPAELDGLLTRILRRSARRPSKAEERVTIPGYRDLRELSLEHEALLKRLGGAAWESYAQRGHWRMILPFGTRHQTRTAERLLSSLADGRPRILHLVRFPRLSINHAVLAYAASPTDDGIEFVVADPNDPSQPRRLFFERATGRFRFPATPYFAGGRVDVYEVFHGAWY